MVQVKEDMTGWRMWEHGIPDSRLIVKRQVEDQVESNGDHTAMWECECNCSEHNTVTTSGRRIRSGHVLSCGCIKKECIRKRKFIDMTGWIMKEHGVPESRLTVMYQVDDYVNPTTGAHIARWHCKCECENEIDTCGYRLRDKKNPVLSCGCRHIEAMMSKCKKHNDYNIIDDIVYIQLSNCDDITTVNIDKWENIDFIREFCWFKDSQGYASAPVPSGMQSKFGKKTVKLHQLICPCEDGYEPDHRDRNKLNNTTANLMQTTHSLNNHNKDKPKTNTSGVKGVGWHKAANKWIAQITVNDQHIYLGLFANKEDAIKARKDAEIKYGVINIMTG